MKRKIILSVVLLTMVISAGCYRTVYRAEDLNYLVTMNQPKAGEAVVSHFRVRVWNHFFIDGLFPTSVPDLKQIMSENVPPGHEVRNLTIRNQLSFLNILLGVVTAGVYTPRTTIVSGDVVKSGAPSQAAAQR